MTSGVPSLYDAPGPRARRRAAIGTALAGSVLAALLLLVVRRLGQRGQFGMDRWGPLIDPGDDRFGPVWQRLGQGFGATLVAAALAITLSGLLGTALGVTRMLAPAAVRVPIVMVIEVLRGLPVIVLIFIAYRLLPTLGFGVSALPGPDGLWYLVIGLTAYNSVIVAEILRAGVAALPRGQREAALAVGLTPLQAMRLVLLPQAFRAMLPALISQLVVVLKDTSLAALLALYVELLRQGLLIEEVLGDPLQVLFVVALIFIAVNSTLSRLAVRAERRLGRSRHVARAAAPDPVSPAVRASSARMAGRP